MTRHSSPRLWGADSVSTHKIRAVAQRAKKPSPSTGTTMFGSWVSDIRRVLHLDRRPSASARRRRLSTMVTLPTTTTRVDTTTAERINTDPVLDVITTAPASTETSETPAPATTTDANENANALGNTYAYLTRIMDSTPVNVTTENTVATAEPRIVVETPGVVTPGASLSWTLSPPNPLQRSPYAR